MTFQNDQCPPDYPPGRVWCSGLVSGLAWHPGADCVRDRSLRQRLQGSTLPSDRAV